MKKLFILFIILLVKPAFSQQYNYTNYTPNDGLPSSEVYHVIQDSKGYIWFATDNGVSRFDGYEFKNFTTENGLPDNTIFEIYEDFEGKLWFISYSAQLSFFNGKKIVKYKHNEILQKNLKSHTLPAKKGFYINKYSSIYYSDYHNGISVIDSSGNFTKINIKNQLLKIDNKLLFNTERGNLYDSLFLEVDDKRINTGIYLNRYMIDGLIKIALKTTDFNYFSTHNTIFRFSDNGPLIKKEFPYTIIWMSYNNNILWVGSSKGLWGFKNGEINNHPDYHILHNEYISSILIDEENSLWATTLDNGVFFLKNFQIKSITTDNSDISEKQVSALAADSTYLWFGLDNGDLNVLKNKKITNVFKSSDDKIYSRIININPNDNKDIFFSTVSHTYKIWRDPNNNFPEKLRFEPIKLKTKNFKPRVMLIEANDQLWLGEKDGVYIIENLSDKPQYLSKMFDSLNIYSLVKLPNNIILIGTSAGIWRYNKTKNEVKPFYINKYQFQDRITCLEYDPMEKILIIGTKSQGLYIYKRNKLFHFDINKGIKNNFISSIFNYKGETWIGTKSSGAYMIKKDSIRRNNFRIQPYSLAQGLLCNEVNDIYVNDTAAFIATSNGLNIIEYNNFKANKHAPRIYIEQIKTNKKDTILLDNYVLPYNENSISIKLTGLAYKLLGKVKYKYRIYNSVKDTTWNFTASRDIQIPFIPPGTYIFQAKAINENNIESEIPVEIKIKINPPFWKTWWFITIISIFVVIIISLILYSMYKIRIREINKRNTLEKEFIENKNTLEKEIEKFRQQALSQQMNPHFIFNSLNSIQYFIYQNEKTLSNKYLTKFSRLIRIILDNSQHQLISLDNEFEALQLYMDLEEMRLQGKLMCKLEIDKNINTDYYSIPPLLIQPFVENAIWHGIVNKEENGIVSVKLLEENDSFKCIVEDDGIGRKKAKEIQKRKNKTYKSHGSSITEKRLALFSSFNIEEIKIEYTDLFQNNKPSGTRVEFIIPKVEAN